MPRLRVWLQLCLAFAGPALAFATAPARVVVTADADGRFSLPAVRPSRFALRAFATGVLDEFARTDIHVTASGQLDLGDDPASTLLALFHSEREAARGRPNQTKLSKLS